MATAQDIAVWQRVIGTSWEDLPVEAAGGILRLTFSERDVRRITELSEKSSGVPLRPAEQAELENYAMVSRILAIMHSRARRALRAASPGDGRGVPKSRRKLK